MHYVYRSIYMLNVQLSIVRVPMAMPQFKLQVGSVHGQSTLIRHVIWTRDMRLHRRRAKRKRNATERLQRKITEEIIRKSGALSADNATIGKNRNVLCGVSASARVSLCCCQRHFSDHSHYGMIRCCRLLRDVHTRMYKRQRIAFTHSECDNAMHLPSACM